MPTKRKDLSIGPLCAEMQRLQDDDLSDEPLLDEFKVLRRRIFQWNGE